MVWDHNRDDGQYWSCTLMHTPIICRYGHPGPLHKYVKELSLWMCAALLKMQKRAITSSARSKHWFQLHTHKEKYHFNPRQLLSDVVQVYLNLGDQDAFIRAVAGDGRSYRKELIEHAAKICSKATSNRRLRLRG